MKKSVTFLALLLILFTSTLILSDNATNSSSTTTTTNPETNKEKIQLAFECLEEKASDCSGLTTQEIALTILATPDNIFDDCVDELKSKESSNNWGNVRDTALAILALKHAGEDTEPSEEWLIKQNRTPTSLEWFIQQDSIAAAECHLAYNTQDYTINIGENKKIDMNAGPCLTRAQLNFWLEISPDCYNTRFQIECDQDFIANLLYKNKQSPTIYVLDQTMSSPAYGSIDLYVRSKCFGESSCEYEATAWAAAALQETGHNIEEYIPYIIAASETNQKYLPESFIYIVTNYEDYAGKLIAEQKLGNYWEAPSSAYNKYYDTALALIALGSSSSEQITKARDWLYFSQGANGCWHNSIKETAIVLWALEGRAGKSGGGGSSVTHCSEANYFCIPSSECPSEEDVGDSYFCPSLSDTCCINENLLMCSEYAGEVCSSNQVCTGNERKASDTDNCCTGSCQEKPQETECESNFYTCMSSCSEYQEPISTYSCNQGQSCCRTKTTDDGGSAWWIWLLIILILAALGAIGYVYRDKLKLYYFQLKTKFKKDGGKGKGKGPSRGRPGFPPRPGMPPRPGFPPVRRAHSAPSKSAPPKKRSYDRRDKAMSDTFKKLQSMSS
ncbi:hypothetical protein K8R30_00665 [archaeon]|nr:hypothetical protein [archaeon]